MTKEPYKPRGILYDDIPPLPPGWVRVADHKERWEKMRAQARVEAEQYAKLLGEKYGAKRVWLFGSVAGVWQFTEWSDIDLAVEGIPPEKLSPARRELEWASPQKLRVDLRERDDFTSERWERLIPAPVLLYERPGA